MTFWYIIAVIAVGVLVDISRVIGTLAAELRVVRRLLAGQVLGQRTTPELEMPAFTKEALRDWMVDKRPSDG